MQLWSMLPSPLPRPLEPGHAASRCSSAALSRDVHQSFPSFFSSSSLPAPTSPPQPVQGCSLLLCSYNYSPNAWREREREMKEVCISIIPKSSSSAAGQAWQCGSAAPAPGASHLHSTHRNPPAQRPAHTGVEDNYYTQPKRNKPLYFLWLFLTGTQTEWGGEGNEMHHVPHPQPCVCVCASQQLTSASVGQSGKSQILFPRRLSISTTTTALHPTTQLSPSCTHTHTHTHIYELRSE